MELKSVDANTVTVVVLKNVNLKEWWKVKDIKYNRCFQKKKKENTSHVMYHLCVFLTINLHTKGIYFLICNLYEFKKLREKSIFVSSLGPLISK